MLRRTAIWRLPLKRAEATYPQLIPHSMPLILQRRACFGEYLFCTQQAYLYYTKASELRKHDAYSKGIERTKTKLKNQPVLGVDIFEKKRKIHRQERQSRQRAYYPSVY